MAHMNPIDFEMTVMDLVQGYLKADKELKEVRVEVVKRQVNGPPVKPTQCETLQEWFDYVMAVESYKNLEKLVSEAEKRRKAIESQLVALLPTGVWFRLRGMGFGVAFNNWGGAHYYVVTAPWAEKMPSLDHTYKAD